MDNTDEHALDLDRIKAAIATCRAAARHDGFNGAVGAEDYRGTLIEAKRNLTALIQVLHGYDAWDQYIRDES